MRKKLAVLICALSIVAVSIFIASNGKAKVVSQVVNASNGALGAMNVSPRPIPVRDIEPSGFNVEVLVGGAPLEEYPARGRIYVEAVRGGEYALRITNPLPVRVAVALSVDGLNTIDARRTTAREASKWVIMPYQTITITGWQMSAKRARRFYFTTEPDSYATKMGQPSEQGIISAVFFRERQPVEVAPPAFPPEEGEERTRVEERSAPQANAPSTRDKSISSAPSGAIAPVPNDDYAATGIGRSVHNDVHWVNMDYDPNPAGTVAIRYEYYEALVRLGILPRPYTQPDPLRRREQARGFQGQPFCPEP